MVISLSHAEALLDESYMDMLTTPMLGNNETQWSEEYEHTSSTTTPLSHTLSLPFPFTTPPLAHIHHRPLSSSLISLRRCAVQRRGAYLRCEHACIIIHLPCVMAGRGGATDLVATVVMRTVDCAWKQKRSRLIRLSSTSERLLAGVRGRLMRKHKASAGLLSVFVCVGSAEVR